MAVEFEPRLDRRQAAEFLSDQGYRTAPATLAKLASIGGGPIFESFGRKPLYRQADLLAWAVARTSGPRRSTSDPGPKSTTTPDDGKRADRSTNVQGRPPTRRQEDDNTGEYVA
jgi:hypothetical protein